MLLRMEPEVEALKSSPWKEDFLATCAAVRRRRLRWLWPLLVALGVHFAVRKRVWYAPGGALYEARKRNFEAMQG